MFFIPKRNETFEAHNKVADIVYGRWFGAAVSYI